MALTGRTTEVTAEWVEATESEPETETPPAPAIDARDLYRFYHAGEDETLALRGVSLAVERGELVAVVGPSGSGKSTLLACLAGLDDPDGGSVHILGERMSRRPEAERARMRAASIGMLMQTGNLIEHLSVLQNVRMAAALAGRHVRAARELVDAVGLAQRSGFAPSRLSGGEAARAGLAVALAAGPPILLADEPTGEVDSGNEHAIADLLAREAERGVAIVVVTHSDRVAEAASRVVHLEDGVIADE
jgi:putative ABC transport system ATP-binding protein